MTLIPFFIWFAYGLDQCSCWEPFSGTTLLIGFVILSFSVYGVLSSLPSPSLLSFPPSLSLPLFPSPSPSLFLSLWPFSPCSTFFSDLRQDLTMQPGLVLVCLHSPNWPQTLGHPLPLPPGCWNHRCVQSHPGVSFLLNYYISALMHWHLSKQFYVGED